MKFTYVPLALLAAVATAFALPEPAPVAAPGSEPSSLSARGDTASGATARDLQKRAVTGTVNVDGLRYRTCPYTSCTAMGQYSRGTTVTLICWTPGEEIEGDGGWARLGNGYYSAIVHGRYLSWPGNLYRC